jgi:hypothetical protein
MTNPGAIAAGMRRVAGLLAELDDPACLVAAEGITRWLLGQDFESAMGLYPGWRVAVRQRARETALQALCAMFPDLTDVTLARRIIAGMRADDGQGTRPDGPRGLFRDLRNAGADCSARTWREELRKAHGRLADSSLQLPCIAGKLEL